jgi:hypothetical protein
MLLHTIVATIDSSTTDFLAIVLLARSHCISDGCDDGGYDGNAIYE